MSLDDKRTWCGKGHFYPEYNVKQAVKELKKKMKLLEVYKKDKDFNDLMDGIIDEVFGKGLI